MTEQLPLPIIESLQKYYFHRNHQSTDGWDKAADLDLIDKMCTEEKWGYQACAGTFWFSKKLTNGTLVIKVSESTFPDGGISSVKGNGEPFGAFSEITPLSEKTAKNPALSMVIHIHKPYQRRMRNHDH